MRVVVAEFDYRYSSLQDLSYVINSGDEVLHTIREYSQKLFCLVPVAMLHGFRVKYQSTRGILLQMLVHWYLVLNMSI